MFNKPYSYTNYSSSITSDAFPLTSKISNTVSSPLSTNSSRLFLSNRINTNYTDTLKRQENVSNNNKWTRNYEYEHKINTNYADTLKRRENISNNKWSENFDTQRTNSESKKIDVYNLFNLFNL